MWSLLGFGIILTIACFQTPGKWPSRIELFVIMARAEWAIGGRCFRATLVIESCPGAPRGRTFVLIMCAMSPDVNVGVGVSSSGLEKRGPASVTCFATFGLNDGWSKFVKTDSR